MKLESLLQYLDGYLGLSDHPDYANALNGLQVGGPDEVEHLVVAVDASEASVVEAVDRNADLLLVHHGLFWSGLEPLTGRRLRRVRPLILKGVGLYSVHLPLDSHGEVGNCAVLGRALELELAGRFGAYQGVEIGWWGTLPEAVDIAGLQERLADALAGPVHVIPGGPEEIRRVGVVTGGGASFTAEGAAHPSVDSRLITGWFGARPEDVREINLPATTLALLCERHVPPGRTIDFLKVDVEGAERSVLEGAEGTLRRFRPAILIEYAPQLLVANGVEPESILELLEAHGYSLQWLSATEVIAVAR